MLRVAPSVLPTGKYVLYRRNHFQGFRAFSDGTCRLQTSCRCHIGIDCDANKFDTSSFEAIFQVIPLRADRAVDACSPIDFQGGALTQPTSDASSTSTLFEQPNFLDSEFSSPRSLVGSKPVSVPIFMLFPDFLESRIAAFEGLCADYIALLTAKPELWTRIPCGTAACHPPAACSVAI